ncbi:MAG: iron-binding protein [Sulfurimonas sp.]|jgi:hypothetical protein|nr:iron-binding protein [Sulfurimonas sp.]
MNKVYQQKHELWLAIAFTSFAISDEKIKSRLYDFSQIAFRHMKWIGSELLLAGENYNYDREMQLCKKESLFELIKDLLSKVEAMQSHYPHTRLGSRCRSDDAYLVEYLTSLLGNEQNDHPITAFNRACIYEEKDLSKEQIDALTLFLFEESYKEYELVLVYAYMQARTDDVLQFSVFEDLIAESHFHLKSFGNMMAKLGILALPRELHEMSYVISDLEKFVRDGIAEEEAAKEMCRELSSKIKDEELSKFFDFINEQESYHIALMQRLLETDISNEAAMTNLDFDEFWSGVDI